ncbi:hypothetical protein I3843_01G245300 [Carya illinoinensis]|nr:hypothetical protein I3843_01G245300 [Carya illinoinensis]
MFYTSLDVYLQCENTMFRLWVRFATRWKPVPARPFCTPSPSPTTSGSNTTKPPSNNNSSISENNAVESSPGNYDEAYKQLDKLDFATATKILFTDPPKRKKFGLDFHLVQLFFACMPSLAVYLVAQYARYEMRRMEAELEQKKKQEEEKEKEMELSVIEGKETVSDPELLEMKVRLDKLEEAVKGIAVETKKQSISSLAKNRGEGSEERNFATTGPTDTKSGSEPSKIVESDHLNKQDRPWLGRERVSGSAPVPDASLQDQKGKTQN